MACPGDSVFASVCNRGHQRIFRLGNIQAGALYDNGLVAFHQDGVGGVARNGDAVRVFHFVQTNVVGALIGTDRVESAERFPILKIEGQINVCLRILPHG